ncbi:MAG TPA: hypothetical protein VNN21_02885, partial [Dehalococcoidia bacterium]|nr:hypothetical protein [Dehalococcoidia bacterium]
MRSFLVAALTAFSLALVPVGAALAEAPEVTGVRVEAPDRLTVGDRVRYEVSVRGERGTVLTLVRAALPVEVEVVDTPRSRSRPAGDGREDIVVTFELAAFVPGVVEVPPLVLRYATPSGETGEVQTQATRLEVESVLPPGDLEPKGLKPQAELAGGGSAWAPYAAAAGLALAGAAALLWWRRRARRRRRAAALPEPLPVFAAGPEDRARAVLDRAGADFAKDADYVAYYTALGSTVRTYLSE